MGDINSSTKHNAVILKKINTNIIPRVSSNITNKRKLSSDWGDMSN